MKECNSTVWQRIEQRAETDEARRRISIVVMAVTMLREFLTMQARFEAQTPRQMLGQIQAKRQWLEQSAEDFPTRPIQELLHHLDLREVELYHSLLPNALRQAAADAIACDDNQLCGDRLKTVLAPASKKQSAALEQARMIATDPARRRKSLSSYLAQLRCQLSDQAVQKCL